ncbi:MAG TPA: hypothetical protein VMH26_19100 [Burkholderiales bacterium]|nr:hypothetical protein [Burkholderiales bacterium]
MKSKLMLAAVTMLLCVSGPLLAQDAPVMRVIVVQTDNPSAYIKEVLETGRGHLKRLESTGNLRIWKAKYAGSNAGSVIVAIEYPSLTALAEDDKKAAADPALGAWVRSLDKMRKIVSDSLYSEARP